MKILLTGAFGNIGMSTLTELVARKHTVTAFDLPGKANRTRAACFADKIQTLWGDLCCQEDVIRAVQGQDIVIHTAFIIPKLSATGIQSEDRPDFARAVNVQGTKNLVSAMCAQPRPPRLVFTSSLHVFGRTQHLPPPRTATDPVQPIEHYVHHKVECEEMIRESGLTWAILRLGAAFPIRLILDPGMFEVPLENRIEYVHSRDVGVALASAVTSTDIWGKVLLIGGGPRCQFYYRDVVRAVLDATGIRELPEHAFTTTPYSVDWLDTEESQHLLNYQQRTLTEYVQEMRTVLGYRRGMIRMFEPVVRSILLRQSPYLEHNPN